MAPRDEGGKMSLEQSLIDYFQEGAKGAGKCSYLGLEVEHFVTVDDGRPISYEPTKDLPGIRDVLEHLISWYPEPTYNDRGDLLGLAGQDGAVTLEPAAQLEFSVAPFSDVEHIMGAYERFRMRVSDFLRPFGARLVSAGYHPTRRADELALIPKRRYDFMDAYFAHIGSHGMRMMRASASTQVSVDFADEADAVRKMRVASALSPILAAICDNTRIYEGAPNHVPLRRLQLWREVDDLRCGTVPDVFDDGFGFSAYASWLSQTPPIFVTRASSSDPQGPRLREAFDTPACEAYADAPLTRSDVEHIASMFWPDVRLKQFVEIRPADCLPVSCVAGYVALVKGIFYSEASMALIERALGVRSDGWHLASEDTSDAIRSIQEHGLDGVVYGTPLGTWEQDLFDLARVSATDAEKTMLTALERFARQKPWWQAN